MMVFERVCPFLMRLTLGQKYTQLWNSVYLQTTVCCSGKITDDRTSRRRFRPFLKNGSQGLQSCRYQLHLFYMNDFYTQIFCGLNDRVLPSSLSAQLIRDTKGTFPISLFLFMSV